MYWTNSNTIKRWLCPSDEKSTPWRGTGKSTLGTRGSRAMGRSRGHQCPPIRHLGLVSLLYSSKQNDQDYGMSIR